MWAIISTVNNAPHKQILDKNIYNIFRLTGRFVFIAEKIFEKCLNVSTARSFKNFTPESSIRVDHDFNLLGLLVQNMQIIFMSGRET